ncbi:glycosyltransferase family 4 protein [Vibrio sp. PNB22_8_1]|uniref:glycosyltransferase family 4 protein n=1 Tax=unclassified Vibrio TaxID=2614977 RepID=UPI00406A7DC7
MKNAVIIYHHYFDRSGSSRTIGGVQSYIYELSKVLHNLDYQVKIIQVGSSEFCVNDDYSQVLGVKLNKLEGRFISIIKRRLFNKAKSVIESNKDIVIFGSDHFSVKTDVAKTVAIQHGIDWDLPRHFMSGISSKSSFFAKLTKNQKARSAVHGMRKADVKVCVDYNFPNWVRTYLTDDSVNDYQIVPNFTQTLKDHFLCDEVKSNKVEVVFSRRMFEYRGALLFAEAVEKLLSDGVEAHFTFAGTGPELNNLKDKFRNSNEVSFTKYEPNRSLEFHSQYDIAVVPSYGSEGTSLSLLEAMASGCAVIGTNIGGISNILINDWNGLMISPSSDQLYQALYILITDQDKREVLSDNARSVVEESFSLNKWQERWTKILQDLADEPV